MFTPFTFIAAPGLNPKPETVIERGGMFGSSSTGPLSGDMVSTTGTGFSTAKGSAFDLSSASGLELAFDERQAAEEMANLLKTEHYEVVMHAGDMEWVMPELVWHQDEPFASTSIFGECGGYMVLGSGITDRDGVRHAIAPRPGR